MSEGRKSQVILLDDRKLDFIIQPKLTAGDLLDLVASHFNLKEKEYFGLAYLDETGHRHWLHLERRVLEHDLPKKGPLLTLYFAVRFFIESITFLRDKNSVELFYLQAKSLISKGEIECDSEVVFELAAHCLLATYGDFASEESTRNDLKSLRVIPTRILEVHPSLSYCEDKIISCYKKLSGITRGTAIVNYMTIVESLPTYGVHYYRVKDKNGLPWWLGLSYKGIAVYDEKDKKTPRRLFQWKHLENLYFRDRKFSIEVHDAKRVSSSRRTFGPSNVKVHAWLATTPQLCKAIWAMAIQQHQFYLDRKQSKSQVPAIRSMSEIAMELSTSSLSLSSSVSDLSGGAISSSSQSLTRSSSGRIASQELELLNALKERKQALEDVIGKKTEELRTICVKEAEITGCLPKETPVEQGRDPPAFRKRVGTAFQLSDKLNTKETQSQLGQLEVEFELQKKITSAALRLASDPSVPKHIRKQRRQTYEKSEEKLKAIERKLLKLKRQEELEKKSAHAHSNEILASPEQGLSAPNSVMDRSVNLVDLSMVQSPPVFSPPISQAAVRSAIHKSDSHLNKLSADMERDASPSQLGQSPPTVRRQKSYKMATHRESAYTPVYRRRVASPPSGRRFAGHQLVDSPVDNAEPTEGTGHSLSRASPTNPMSSSLASSHPHHVHTVEEGRYSTITHHITVTQPQECHPESAESQPPDPRFPRQKRVPVVQRFASVDHDAARPEEPLKESKSLENPLYVSNGEELQSAEVRSALPCRYPVSQGTVQRIPKLSDSDWRSRTDRIPIPVTHVERSDPSGSPPPPRPPKPAEMTQVREIPSETYRRYTPFVEESKPYETADFYKYSAKYRQQRRSSDQTTSSSADEGTINSTTSSRSSTPRTTSSQSSYTPTSSSRSPIKVTRYPLMAARSPPGYSNENDMSIPMQQSRDNSFNYSLHAADEFGDEMRAWIEDQHDNPQPATLV